ncbi:MAG TPA: hypothetical protein VKM93_13125, partial [Terriglobia bacterium]|nr:hypothetical protein [Terriglobia bacterium]
TIAISWWRGCKSHPIINMFGSFPGSLGRDHYQAYRLEGADAIMESRRLRRMISLTSALPADLGWSLY